MTVNLRIWGIACGAAVVAVIAGGWFVGVQPQLAAAATSAESTANVDAQNQATRIKLIGLTKAAAKLDDMKAENDVLLKNVPSVLKPNTFIRRVSEVAALDGVDVVSVTPSDASAYAAPETITGVSAQLALGKTSPFITGANFAVVPVTVVISGDPDAALQFTHDIQNDQRTFSISGMQNSKSDDSTDVTSSLSGYIYTLKR